jgi:uncharacterized protein (DUF2164 family)
VCLHELDPGMGNVYLMRKGWRLSPNKPVETLVLASEEVGMGGDGAKKVADFVNGEFGVFFYEKDLWKPEDLKRKLVRITQAIDTLDIPPAMVGRRQRDMSVSPIIVQPKRPRRVGKIKVVYPRRRKLSRRA